MIWKTTLAKIFLPIKNVNDTFHYADKRENLKPTSRLGILMTLFVTASFAVNAQSNISSVSGDNCITFDSCPADQVICADSFENGVLGANVSWTDPVVSQTCTPNGRPGNFQMLFELNEQLLTVDCWEFNYISRVGSNGGQIKLFSGVDSYKTKNSVIITPYLILRPGSETSIDVDYVNGDYTVQLYLIDENDNEISMSTPPRTVDGSNITYTFFTPNTESGVFRLKYVFEFSGKEPSNANNGDTLIAVDGMLSDNDNCSAGVDFTVTAPKQGFFPVGSHDLQYIATYSAPDGTIKTKTCSFNITVHATPVADDPADVVECDSYTLPALNTGNQYFTGTEGTGSELFADDIITSTQDIYVYAAASAPCVADENMFTVTINNTPVADAPSNVSECDSYTLPALSPGNQYFTGQGATGTELFADDVITTSQDIYVYAAATTPCVPDENMFSVTINDTPLADAPGDVERCDSYILPALANGAYFASQGGVDPITEGTEITETQTIYVFSPGTGACEDVENSFIVTINDTPLAEAPGDVERCDSYILPALINGAYFASPGGVDPINEGTEITANQTIYIFSGGTGSCENVENSFEVTINDTPLADAPGDVERCDSYILPALTNGAYFASPGGIDSIAEGTDITATQTIYVFSAGTGSCENVENSFQVTINDTPLADAPADIERCDSYILPALTNGAYYASPDGVDPIAEGTEITATQTIYVFSAGTGSCENVENSFEVTINDTPLADAPGDVERCDSYILPTLTNGAYFASPGGVDPIAEGTEITATQTIYVFSAGTGSCENVENSFEVTINDTPLADAPVDIERCDSYILPSLTNGAYYASPGGVDPIAEGTEITATQTIYVFSAGTGSCENVENSFKVTINTTPIADAPGNIERCDSYILPALTNGAYFASQGGTDPIAEGTEITASQTIYVYSVGTGSCENVENSFTVTITDTPTVDAPADVERCDSYILPNLNNGAYFGAQGGIDPIAEGAEITATQTIYVFSPGSGSCQEAENFFEVTINHTPLADAPGDVERCESYILPALTDGAYYASPGGTDPIAEGTEIAATQTIYVFSEASGSCEDVENSFTVTINNPPIADTPGDVERCDSYTLPDLTNGAYYTSPGGVDPISEGTEITTTQTIYVFSAGSGSCENAENSFEIKINETPAPPIIQVVISPSCGETTGSFGICCGPGMEYSIDEENFTNNPIFEDLLPGTYYVVARSPEGCISEPSEVIIEPQPETPSAPVVNSTTQPDCEVPTGSFTVTTEVGLEYSIDGTNFNTTGEFNELTTGKTYEVVAKNADGCVSEPTPVIIDPQPETPTAPVVNLTTQPDCEIPTGSFSVITEAGLEYSIDGTNFNTTGEFNELTPGQTFDVVARNADGCVSEPTPVTIDPQPETPDAPVVNSTTQPSCEVPTGSFTVTTEAGLEYSIDGTDFNTTGEFNELTPGETYEVVARNADGCVSEPIPVTIDPQPETPAAPVIEELFQPVCENPSGMLVLSFIEGITYSIKDEEGNTIADTDEDGIFDDLTAGTYTVTAENETGCLSQPTPFTIEEQPETPAAPEVSVTQPTCATPTGSLEITAVDGMVYRLNDGEYSSTTSFSELEPATYTVTARNADGCESESIVTLTEPEAAVIETAAPRSLCIEDSVFSLSEMLLGDYDESGTWEDPSNTGALENASIDPSLLALGNYTFDYVIEGNCPSTTSVQININDDCVVLACGIEDVKESISKAVTPNGDNINDYFTIGLDLDCGFVYGVKIFNRWGNKVYESNNYQNNWDGTSRTSVTGDQLPAGTYYYIVEISGLEPVQGYIYLGTK